MNVLIVSVLLAIVIGIAKLVRRMNDIENKIDHAVAETNIEASITRRYLGRLGGDPGLQEPTIDCGTDGAKQ